MKHCTYMHLNAPCLHAQALGRLKTLKHVEAESGDNINAELEGLLGCFDREVHLRDPCPNKLRVKIVQAALREKNRNLTDEKIEAR